MNKKYKSSYAVDLYIRADQYLVELIMTRNAKKNKESLPHKFWNIPKFGKQFRMQIKFANELLSEYSEAEVFAALRSKKGQCIYSLGAKKTMIEPLIEAIRKNKAEKNSVGVECEMDELDIYEDIEQIPEKDLHNKNLWSKLG